MKAFSAWPILWQLSGLALAAVVSAQTIGFGIIALYPPAPAKGVTIDDVLSAIKSRDEDKFAYDISGDPPFSHHERSDGTPMLIASSIADGLQLQAADVQVEMIAQDGEAFLPSAMQAPGPSGGVAVFRPGSVELDKGKPPPLPKMLRMAAIAFAPFAVAVRQGDGSWLVIAPQPSGWLTPIQQRLLMAFALSVAIIGPLSWAMARRMAQPMRRVAEAAEAAEPSDVVRRLAPDGAPELRALIGAINGLRERLHRHVEERTRAIAAIAHDLRTPLTGLRLRAEAVQPELRARMTADIDRLIQMVEQVVAFVRGEQMREPCLPIDFGELALDCAREISETGADVECRTEPGVWVVGEPVNLRRALTNLIDNAVKFGARARVSVARKQGRAVFQVEDDGPGLPPDVREQVFEPFMRLESSRNRATGGAGLGLALVSTVVRVHDGTIELENRPEGGLAVRVSIPASMPITRELAAALQPTV